MTKKERLRIVHQAFEHHVCLDRASNARRNRVRFAPLTVALARLCTDMEIEHPDIDEVLENS